MSDIKDAKITKDTIDAQTLREDATRVYIKLKQLFFDNTNPNAYWQLGCCFDTMTDALRILGPGADRDQPTLAKVALIQYNKTVGGWYDDFAWWSIASAKAYDPAFATIFGEYTEIFQHIAQTCWWKLDQGLDDGVHKGSSQAFLNKDNQEFFTKKPPVPSYWVVPRFDKGRGSGLHGVWQTDIFANKRDKDHGWYGPDQGGPNPAKPENCPDCSPTCVRLGPYQNTVVNALYFLNTVRLEQARKTTHPAIPTVAQQLHDEYGFLSTWMNNDPAQPLPANETLLHKEFGDGTAFVRERVSTYARNNVGKYPPVENWDARTSWGGDQGLLINAFADYLQQFPNDTLSQALLPMLVLGYTRHMVDANGVPQPYFPFSGNKLACDDADYKSGIGVFMRGVLQAAQISDGPVAKKLVPLGEFQTFLAHAVKWAQAAQPVELFECLNVLATMLAGIELAVPAHLQVEDPGYGLIPQPRQEG